MSRFIMLSFIGILAIFLFLNFMAVVGLNSIAGRVEKNIVVNHLNEDIDFLCLQLSHYYTDAQAWNSLNKEVEGLHNRKLQKRCSKENLKASSLQVGKASHKMALYFEEKTKNCIGEQASECLREALLVFVESLAISGRQLRMDFNEEEKELYRKILAMKHNPLTEKEIMQLSSEALPVFSNTMSRLQELLMTFNKSQDNTSDRS